jgi:hypothetical protein
VNVSLSGGYPDGRTRRRGQEPAEPPQVRGISVGFSASTTGTPTWPLTARVYAAVPWILQLPMWSSAYARRVMAGQLTSEMTPPSIPLPSGPVRVANCRGCRPAGLAGLAGGDVDSSRLERLAGLCKG